MHVEIVRDPSVLEAFQKPWAALHTQSRTATLFNTPHWAQVWWRHFGDAESLRLFLVRDAAGALVGLAPMYLTENETGERLLRFVGGVDVSDYLDVLACAGAEQHVAEALVAAWAELCRCEGVVIDLYGLPDASPMREAFLRAAPLRGLCADSARAEVCPVLELPPDWESYLAGLARKQRHELRRKVRKAGQEALVSWYQVRGVTPAEVVEAMETFFALHASSGPDKAAFMTPRMRAFFLDMAQTMAAAGWFLLDVLLVNGQPAAAYLTFDYEDAILLYNSGYDPTLLPEMSPGWVLLAYGIERAIALGRRRFDFLRGNEEYKYQFGGRSTSIHRLRLARAA